MTQRMPDKLGRKLTEYFVLTNQCHIPLPFLLTILLTSLLREEVRYSIREMTEGAGSLSCEINRSGSELVSFTPVSDADTAQLVRQTPVKQCSLDPVPTWLLKDCIDLLAPFITSFSFGCVLRLFSAVTPADVIISYFCYVQLRNSVLFCSAYSSM